MQAANQSFSIIFFFLVVNIFSDFLSKNKAKQNKQKNALFSFIAHLLHLIPNDKFLMLHLSRNLHFPDTEPCLCFCCWILLSLCIESGLSVVLNSTKNSTKSKSMRKMYPPNYSNKNISGNKYFHHVQTILETGCSKDFILKEFTSFCFHFELNTHSLPCHLVSYVCTFLLLFAPDNNTFCKNSYLSPISIHTWSGTYTFLFLFLLCFFQANSSPTTTFTFNPHIFS